MDLIAYESLRQYNSTTFVQWVQGGHGAIVNDFAEWEKQAQLALAAAAAAKAKAIEDAQQQAAQEEAGQYEVDGILTDAGIAALRQLMPEVPAAEFVDWMRVTEVPEVFRVATFYNLVCHLMDQKAHGDGATG